MTAVRRWLLAMLIAAGTAAAIPGVTAAARAEDPAEARYVHYRKVIHAAERCRLDFPFGTPEQSRMAGYIDAKVDHAISAGRRLTLIEKAKSDVNKLVDKHGCGHDVADLLAVYDKELAPLLKP